MFKLYRFSPIKSKEEFLEAIDYVATQTTKLCKKITGQEYPIGPTLTVCSHYPDEYEYLKSLLLTIGKHTDDNNGPRVIFDKPINPLIAKNVKIRVRIPDPYRSQVGCNDFIVPNYLEFKDKYLAANPKNLRLIQRPEYDMIEFFDPDFDVLAYVLSN